MIDKARLRRAYAPAIPQWEPKDGVDFVVAKTTGGGDVMFFVRSPSGWSADWRKATRFKSRTSAQAMITPKTVDTPAGPAAERGAEVRQLGPRTIGGAA